MYNKYLNNETDYLKEFDDIEFGKLYNKHSNLYYLEQITKAMLAEINTEYTPEQYNNFKSWVFMFGHTIRDRKDKEIKLNSDKLKETIKSKIGQSLFITIQGEGIFGNIEKANKYKIRESNKGIFLMPPKAKTKGYSINNLIILDIQGV